MIIKNAIRNALLALAVGSLLYVAAREVADRQSAPGDGSPVKSEAPVGPGAKLVVYYFSQGKECTTCEQIPAYTREVLEKDFAPQLASGEMVWRMIDVDQPRNEHYVDEYSIYTKSIVLAHFENGKQTRWENLASIWELVYDKAAFVDYVQKEVRKALEATP